jgi:hypothetical protein
MNEDSTLSLSHEERLRDLSQEVERLTGLVGELFCAKYQLSAEMDAALGLIHALRLRVRKLEDKEIGPDTSQPHF